MEKYRTESVHLIIKDVGKVSVLVPSEIETGALDVVDTVNYVIIDRGAITYVGGKCPPELINIGFADCDDAVVIPALPFRALEITIDIDEEYRKFARIRGVMFGR